MPASWGSPVDVVVVDALTEAHRRSLLWLTEHSEITVVDGDIRDCELVGALMHGVDVLFHQWAPYSTSGTGDIQRGWDRAIDGLNTVLGTAVRAEVHKVVLGLLPYSARNPAAPGRATPQRLLGSLTKSHDLDYIVLHYADLYGPHIEAPALFSDTLVRWIRDIDAGQPPVIPGGRPAARDLVFIDDAARANVLAAVAPVTGRACHVATGARTTLRRLAALLLRVMGVAMDPVMGPRSPAVPRAPGRMDPATARELFGFRTEIGLENGLRSLVDWWRGLRPSQRPV
jgi:UDP-glucose 4-epimerase